MGVFWSRGYHATALPDLLRATKLSRGSLYAAFGFQPCGPFADYVDDPNSLFMTRGL